MSRRMDLELEEDRREILDEMLDNSELSLDQGIIKNTTCSFCDNKPKSSEIIKCMRCKSEFHAHCLADQIPLRTVHALLYNPSLWWFCLNCVAFYNPSETVNSKSLFSHFQQGQRLMSEENVVAEDVVEEDVVEDNVEEDGASEKEFSDISTISLPVSERRKIEMATPVDVDEIHSESVKTLRDHLPAQYRTEPVFGIGNNGWSTKDESLGFLQLTPSRDDARSASPPKRAKSPACKAHSLSRSENDLRKLPVWKNPKPSVSSDRIKDVGILQENLRAASAKIQDLPPKLVFPQKSSEEITRLVESMKEAKEDALKKSKARKDNLDHIKAMVEQCKNKAEVPIEEIPPPPPVKFMSADISYMPYRNRNVDSPEENPAKKDIPPYRTRNLVLPGPEQNPAKQDILHNKQGLKKIKGLVRSSRSLGDTL